MPIVELSIDSSGALTGARQYDAATAQITGSTQKAESSIQRMRDSVNRLGPILAAGAAAAGAAFVAIGKRAIDAASDMEETQNKFNVVFRGMEDEAESWASELVNSYQMTSEEAKRFLASTQDLLKPMGVATDTAGEMSNEVAKLAADIGSFNNQPTERVMQGIQSALVGNYESMKQYGVVLNAAAVEQEALTSGLLAQGEELDAATRAQAAYQLILKGTEDAQGDIARSSGSYANLLKQLNANMGELMIQLGEKFLPIAAEVLSHIVEWTKNQENLNKIVNAAVETVRALYNAYQGIVVALKAVIVAVARFAEVTVKSFRVVMKPMDLLFKGIERLGGPANPFDLATEAVEDFSAASIESLLNTWQTIEDGNQYFDNLKQKTEEISGAYGEATAQGGEMNDMLEEQAEALDKVAQAAAHNAAVTTTMTETVVKGNREITSTYQMVVNELGEWEKQLVGTKSQLIETNQTKEQGAQLATQLSSANQTAARSYQSLAQAASGAATSMAAANGAAAGGAGGGGGGGGGGGVMLGYSRLPEWFTPEMVREYSRHASEVLRTGTPHLGPLAGGPGNAPSRSMRDRRSEARREYYRQQYDPYRWARLQGYDPIDFGYTESGINFGGGGGITVNVNQELSKQQLANLIAELERSQARQ